VTAPVGDGGGAQSVAEGEGGVALARPTAHQRLVVAHPAPRPIAGSAPVGAGGPNAGRRGRPAADDAKAALLWAVSAGKPASPQELVGDKPLCPVALTADYRGGGLAHVNARV
jgi:hypothetical protein